MRESSCDREKAVSLSVRSLDIQDLRPLALLSLSITMQGQEGGASASSPVGGWEPGFHPSSWLTPGPTAPMLTSPLQLLISKTPLRTR